jgi:hypothetical protein
MEIQAKTEASARLVAKNKEAARLHLLKVQQLLAQKPLRN